MRMITFEYWGWEMPAEGFVLYMDEKIVNASKDINLLLQDVGIKINKSQFDYFWKNLSKIKSKKLEKQNIQGRMICDGMRITMKLSKGRREKVTYISNPDEEYFMENNLEECIKWLELYKKVLDLIEETGVHICECMDLRNNKDKKAAAFTVLR